MSLDLATLVDPSDYDAQLYDLLHNVLDRTLELASKADTYDLDGADESEDIVVLARSQANFTPAEQSEHQLCSHLLNVLIGTCITRRSALFHSTQQEAQSDDRLSAAPDDQPN